MNNIGGLIFGMIAGAIGAAVWAAIAWFGNMEIGWIAWGIGALVGFAVSLGSREKGMLPAVIAVVITVASLCAGKYATVALAINRVEPSLEFSDDDYIAGIAFQLAEEAEAAGQPIVWKNGRNSQTAKGMADLPNEFQDQARQSWNQLTTEEKSVHRDEAKEAAHDAIRQMKNEFAVQGFINSFSVYDLLFFGLGIFTAGSIAFRDPVESGSAPRGEAEDTV